MTFTSDSEISHLAKGMIACNLPKAEWTHTAHFAAAFWLLSHPDHDPFTQMPDMIRRYNESVGVINSDTDGYHETITQASLKAAKYFLDSATRGAAVFETCNALLLSEFGSSDWILNHWSKETLFSVKARREWVEPDIKELPF